MSSAHWYLGESKADIIYREALFGSFAHFLRFVLIAWSSVTQGFWQYVASSVHPGTLVSLLGGVRFRYARNVIGFGVMSSQSPRVHVYMHC